MAIMVATPISLLNCIATAQAVEMLASFRPLVCFKKNPWSLPQGFPFD